MATDPSTYKERPYPPNPNDQNIVFSDGTTQFQRDMWAHQKTLPSVGPPPPIGSSIVPLTTELAEGQQRLIEATNRVLGKSGDSPLAVIEQKKQEVASPKKLQFPSSQVGNMKYGMQFKFMKQSYEKYGDKSKFTNEIAGSHIFLPMPTSVMETLNANYNVSELGAAGTLFEAGAGAMNALVSGKFGNGTTAERSAMIENAVKDTMNVSGYVVRRMISALSPETAQAVDLKYGQVVNPYTVAVFQSTTPRNHSLTFRLIPRNAQESADIRAIVDAFKYHSMPSRASGGNESTAGIFLKMPEEVEVCFYGTQFLYKFARCVIQNVQVNYTPFGTPSFFAGSDGAPTAVELTLGLQEIEQLTKESYGDNHTQYAMV